MDQSVYLDVKVGMPVPVEMLLERVCSLDNGVESPSVVQVFFVPKIFGGTKGYAY